MNAAQKKGVGMIIAVMLFSIPTIVQTFGIGLPGWLPVVAQVIQMAAGIFGISVNLPSNTGSVGKSL
jgi:hypothetical protein